MPSADPPAAPAAEPAVEDLLRELAPQVLGALVRRYGHFDTAEDAVQEASLAALAQWPAEGRPADPRAWLIRVASRKLIDLLRAEQARARREGEVVAQVLPQEQVDPGPAGPGGRPVDHDDSLLLLFLCCHPALNRPAQVALTLRAVGGLTTGEIARAFLVPEPTMGQRISRAKKQVRAAGARFRTPPAAELTERVAAVLTVLYLIFNEGYAASSGGQVIRHDLAAEAIRLARMVRAQLPEDPEVAGLLALMLLTDARRAARTGPDGELIPLDAQDRTRWDAGQIAEGSALVATALAAASASGTRPGHYLLQAAIAAVHDQSPSTDATDWEQILALYDVLASLADNPVVRLNRAVALAMVRGPRAGLAAVDELDGDPRISGSHRVDAVRAHLLERAGETAAAVISYRAAAAATASEPERVYLERRAAALIGSGQ